jgi:hypothetical protein
MLKSFFFISSIIDNIICEKYCWGLKYVIWDFDERVKVIVVFLSSNLKNDSVSFPWIPLGSSS